MVITYGDDYTRGLVPQSEQKSIASCIRMIASTPYGTVPYARGMGMKKLFPGNNSDMEKNEYASDLAEAVEGWEDRVTVKEVSLTEDGEAKVVIGYGEQRA